MKERLGKTEFVDRVRRNVVGEWHIYQSPLSLKKLAKLIRCTETNVYVRSRDQEIIQALNKCNIYLKDFNNQKCFVFKTDQNQGKQEEKAYE